MSQGCRQRKIPEHNPNGPSLDNGQQTTTRSYTKQANKKDSNIDLQELWKVAQLLHSRSTLHLRRLIYPFQNLLLFIHIHSNSHILRNPLSALTQ